jgi:hypothetical protein
MFSVCGSKSHTSAFRYQFRVSELNGKEIDWTFSEHLTNVKFLYIRSALLVLAHAYRQRDLLALQIVSNAFNYEYRVLLIDTMLVRSAIKFPHFG